MIAAGLCLGTASLLSPCGHAAASMVMDVSSVTISGNQQWSESMIRRMVPVLRESKIDRLPRATPTGRRFGLFHLQLL